MNDYLIIRKGPNLNILTINLLLYIQTLYKFIKQLFIIVIIFKIFFFLHFELLIAFSIYVIILSKTLIEFILWECQVFLLIFPFTFQPNLVGLFLIFILSQLLTDLLNALGSPKPNWRLYYCIRTLIQLIFIQQKARHCSIENFDKIK